ncbi:putative glycoside hydrolase family 30 protein beta-glucosidase/xylosidase [Phytophthora cinnamomi]|uniref:putative glycoside hydrolase family 30 protein beta-glucosidase/xylosidase n=1 Tax=Phytophthora cinnamomi TaxID=4785 RepID=UPI00355AA157|nr:putative glycoside hydrolase family 30 protein beta-glucosidase/xylosidase [Phytophthora cinnamomi]
MIGFGGAFTDAAAINVYKLSSTLQQMVLDQYFSETGLQYNLGRVPIGSTDFSTSVYSYNDVVDDFEMEHFSIAVDKSSSSHKIDLIQRALKASSRNPGEEYWEALALYYSKFFDAYSDEGIDFWAMTVQNEPSSSILQTSEWQSLRLTTEQERDFVKLDLGPMMAKNHPDLKIIAGDDQKSGILDRLAPFEDADALKYISGLGVHWYRDLDFFSSA